MPFKKVKKSELSPGDRIYFSKNDEQPCTVIALGNNRLFYRTSKGDEFTHELKTCYYLEEPLYISDLEPGELFVWSDDPLKPSFIKERTKDGYRRGGSVFTTVEHEVKRVKIVEVKE